MDLKDHINSVPEEQFGSGKTDSENTGNPKISQKSVPEASSDFEDEISDQKDHSENNSSQDDALNEFSSADFEDDAENFHEEVPDLEVNNKDLDGEVSDHEKNNKETVGELRDHVKNNKDSAGEVPDHEGNYKDSAGEEPDYEENIKDSAGEEPDHEENNRDSAADEVHVSKIKATPDSRERINYSLLGREDLVKILDEYLSKGNISEIRQDVELIKTNFYKKLKAEHDQLHRTFIAEGGTHEDFKPSDDPLELEMRGLLKKYRDLRLQSNRNLDDEKQENLAEKYEIIEEIKDLVNRQESINKTFQDFRELQDRWRSIGAVPQANLNDLWETYHHHVEKFYDYIKINKELKDLDLKKNLEEKILLTEKSEKLLLEPNILNAFKVLQKYHEDWREIGPVPKEKRGEIWERFKEATSKVNRKHQQYYQTLKDQQRTNYEQKLLMCNKAEELAVMDLVTHQEWIRRTNEILELQKVWKSIGFAPRRENNEVYSRFRKACDAFFERKRNFYAHNMEEHNSNYQIKLELCLQAEALQDSSDWKKSTEDLIRLQRKWKQSGPVPRKYSDQVWKRFSAACDKFFNRKSTHFKNIDQVYDTNLKLKEALIEEVKHFKSSGVIQNDLSTLQDFQRRWTEIGFVPIDKKEEIQQKFRDAINQHFDKLDVDDVQKNVLKYESHLETLVQKPHSGQKLKFEREKFMNKLLQMKNEISVYENNIGFFANSSNADEMKRDFEQKILNTKQKIKLLEEKINLIDDLDLDI